MRRDGCIEEANRKTDLAFQQPGNAEEIANAAQGAAADGVFRNAAQAGTMVNWHFDEAEAGVAQKGGDEAVKAVERHEQIYVFATKGL